MLIHTILLDITHIALYSHLLPNPMQSLLGRLLYSIYQWWECGRKRLIELPKIPLGNWVQPPIVTNLTWVLSVLIDVFPVTHPVSLATFLPSHNLFHFQFCRSLVSELRPGSPVRMHWALLLTHTRNTLSSLRNVLKGLSFCVCHWELIFTDIFISSAFL